MGKQQRRPANCPPWCSLRHGIHRGEEDSVHISNQLCVRNTLMRLCLSIDPATGEQDGPYLLMGAEEFTMDEVDALTTALAQLVQDAKSSVVPQQVEGTLPVADS